MRSHPLTKEPKSGDSVFSFDLEGERYYVAYLSKSDVSAHSGARTLHLPRSLYCDSQAIKIESAIERAIGLLSLPEAHEYVTAFAESEFEVFNSLSLKQTKRAIEKTAQLELQVLTQPALFGLNSAGELYTPRAVRFALGGFDYVLPLVSWDIFEAATATDWCLFSRSLVSNEPSGEALLNALRAMYFVLSTNNPDHTSTGSSLNSLLPIFKIS
jgi:hypothetical protein